MFGGLTGSGGVVPVGGSTSYTFSVDIADLVPVGGPGGVVSGNFNLRMIVNPEPGSLILGVSALGFAGVFGFRRRKSLVKTEELSEIDDRLGEVDKLTCLNREMAALSLLPVFFGSNGLA